MSIKKNEIVKKKLEFNNIIQNGHFYKGTYYIIYIMKRTDDLKRFGIAIGKKVGNAVTRNKLKRQTRAIIDENKKLFSKGFDYIIMIKRTCSTASYQELNDNLVSIVKEKVKN